MSDIVRVYSSMNRRERVETRKAVQKESLDVQLLFGQVVLLKDYFV